MILVTGANGFIGRSLTNALTLGGYEWRAFEGNLNNPSAIHDQVQGIAKILHLAGAEARGRARLLQRTDIDGTERLLKEARLAGVEHIIVPSRIGADPNSLHQLLRTKGVVERLVRNGRIPYTILRTSTLFGLGDRFTEMILGLALWSWPIVWLPGGGTIAMQPLWVEDYARCLIETLHKPELINQTITLAGDERFGYQELVSHILRVEGVQRQALKLPLFLLRPSAAFLFGWWYWPAVSRFFVDRFFVPEIAELDSVRRYFGFQPMRFRETMAYLHRPGMRWRIFRR